MRRYVSVVPRWRQCDCGVVWYRCRKNSRAAVLKANGGRMPKRKTVDLVRFDDLLKHYIHNDAIEAMTERPHPLFVAAMSGKAWPE